MPAGKTYGQVLYRIKACFLLSASNITSKGEDRLRSLFAPLHEHAHSCTDCTSGSPQNLAAKCACLLAFSNFHRLQEEIVEHGHQVEPPGFHLIQLAFADDIRDNTLTQTTFCYQPVPDSGQSLRHCFFGTIRTYHNALSLSSDEVIGTEVVGTMGEITQKLKLPTYQPDNFPNPGRILSLMNLRLPSIVLTKSYSSSTQPSLQLSASHRTQREFAGGV